MIRAKSMRYLVLAICLSMFFSQVMITGFADIENSIEYMDVAANGFNTVALSKDGTVWAWGMNTWGQLDGANFKDFRDRSQSAKVSGLTDVIAIASGYYHTVVLKKDKTIWTWGLNPYGQLGSEAGIIEYKPVKVSGINDVKALAAGFNHTVALKSNGDVWSWGKYTDDIYDAEYPNVESKPVKVDGIQDITAIAAGSSHTLALKRDGTVWAWGNNSSGQLGDGSTERRNKPVQIKGLNEIKYISAGARQSIAIKKDGTLYVWGTGSYSGDEEIEKKNVNPVKLMSITGIRSVAVDTQNNFLILKEDSTVWYLGNDLIEQAETGKTIQASSIRKYGKLNDIQKITAGMIHFAALNNNGTLWGWGSNISGELGYDVIENQDEPVKINGYRNVLAREAFTFKQENQSKQQDKYKTVDDGNGVIKITDIASEKQIFSINLYDIGFKPITENDYLIDYNSPSSKFLFVSQSLSGKSVLINLESKAIVNMLIQDADYLIWSPSEKKVIVRSGKGFSAARDSMKIYLWDLEKDSTLLMKSGYTNIYEWEWMPDEQYIYYIDYDAGQENVWCYTAEGKWENIYSTGRSIYGSSFKWISPNEFVYIAHEQKISIFTVLTTGPLNRYYAVYINLKENQEIIKEIDAGLLNGCGWSNDFKYIYFTDHSSPETTGSFRSEVNFGENTDIKKNNDESDNK